MTSILQTVEAVYENGLLRPLKPIQGLDNQVYVVLILNPDTERTQEQSQTNHSLHGKYRGYLSSADEFAQSKQVEKALER
jgi:predicted DNA-binding antitoxin AbrB/MazE fold protein